MSRSGAIAGGTTHTGTAKGAAPKVVVATIFVAALMYFGFGLALLLFPVELLAAAEIDLRHPTAIMEARAFYGGLELGLGLFLFLSLWRGFHAYALTLVFFILTGTLIGRVLGALWDGIEGMYWYYAMLVEVPIWVAAVFAARSFLRSQPTSGKLPA